MQSYQAGQRVNFIRNVFYYYFFAGIQDRLSDEEENAEKVRYTEGNKRNLIPLGYQKSI